MPLTRNLARTSVPGLAVLALSGLAATPAAAQTTVTVGSLQNSPGGNILPFGTGSQLSYPEEYQQIYSAAAFTGVSGTLAITSVSFASLSGATPRRSLDATYNLTVGLSQAAAGKLSAPSTIYANNIGSNYATVFNGTITRTLVGTGDTFDLTIPTSTFNYDPALGDLLLDVKLDRPPTVSRDFPAFVVDATPQMSRVRTYGGIQSADAGLGLVTRFMTGANNFGSGPPLPPVSAAPEPSPLAAFGLTGFGALGLVVNARCKKSVLS